MKSCDVFHFLYLAPVPSWWRVRCSRVIQGARLLSFPCSKDILERPTKMNFEIIFGTSLFRLLYRNISHKPITFDFYDKKY